jgi:XTP/dITP diphosphohydrolase
VPVGEAPAERASKPVEVFLASRNAKKLTEMQRILDQALSASGGPGVRVLGLDDVAHYDEPVEDQPTFEGNALLKARAAHAATGLPSVADDSGLCVDALNGMPGVLSARWSGRPKDDDRNNRLLLDQLEDVPDDRRGARFRCAVALCHDRGEVVVEGVMPGRVIRELRGTGGFGYDVLFVPDDQPGELTSAEMDPATKDVISHRGKALRELAPEVAALLGRGQDGPDVGEGGQS